MDNEIVKMLLGLEKLSANDEDYTYVKVRQSRLAAGHPVIVPTDRLERDDVFYAVYPFPQRDEYVPRDIMKVKQPMVNRFSGVNDTFKKVNQRTVSGFKKDMFELVANLAKTEGTAVVLLNQESATKMLDGFDEMLKMFKYSHVVTLKHTDPRNRIRVAEDTIKPALTVFDIRLCMPVFNHRRCDGIGLSYELVLPKSSSESGKLISFGLMAVLLSNFRDNLFYVDGVDIRAESPMHSATLEELKDMTNSKLPDIGKEKKKARAKKTGHSVGWFEASSSTCSSYYYTNS